MKLKPWYDVVKPRSDLREGKAFHVSGLAVRLAVSLADLVA
jgi:hypothetical protein